MTNDHLAKENAFELQIEMTNDNIPKENAFWLQIDPVVTDSYPLVASFVRMF